MKQSARRRAGLARGFVVIGCVALAVVAAPATLVVHAAQAATVKPVAAAGIGTEAARNAPWCDPKDARIAIPHQSRPRCVRPLEKGESNGGATYAGVDKDSIKVVAIVPTKEQQRAAVGQPGVVPPTNRATNAPGYLEDAVVDWLTVLEETHPTWGRKIEFVVFNPTGTSEEAQRADALAVIAMKPFAVMNAAVTSNTATGAGPAFVAAIASAKILVFTATGTNQDAAAQAPYRWQAVFDNDASAVNGAEFIGKALVGETAKWAGDPALRTKTRVFGAIYPDRNLTFDYFEDTFAKHKGAKLTTKVQYTVPLDPGMIAASNQQEAPILMAKLKEEGVTSVIVYTSSAMVREAMKAATNLNYFPEWIFPGLGVLDLEVITRGFDPAQLPHAFGIGSLLINVANGTDPATTYFNWYWGTNQGTYSAGVLSYLKMFITGVMQAGPKLTPQTFQQALFSGGPSGGAASNSVQSYMSGFGRSAGLPYDEYSTIGLDYAMMWWNPNATGKSKISPVEGKGMFMYLNNGKRYHAGQWPKGEPKFFDPGASIMQFDTMPPTEIPKDYPCKGCPSVSA